MQWINPLKLVRIFKHVLDHVIDNERLSDPAYRKRILEMSGDTETPPVPNMQTAVNPPAPSEVYPPVSAPNPKPQRPEKKPDKRKQYGSMNNSFSLYMPQVRHTQGIITKLGEFEFAGNWKDIPYVVVMNAEGNAFVERLGIPLSRGHEPQEYQQYGLPFEAAEAMRWAFLAHDKMSWSVETRLVERKIEKSIVVYEIEEIDVYKCAMWENRHQQITGNGVAERAVDLYRDEKKEA